MKKIALAAAAVSFLMAGAASAADLAPRYAKAPVAAPVAVYNWTGFYIGGNVGGAWGNSGDILLLPNSIASDFQYNGAGAHGPLGSKGGVIGGIQAGYNWQMNSLVLGIEADFNGLDYNTSASQITAAGALAFGGDTINSRRATWLATVRGRLGFAFDRALIYATGGVAFSDLRYGVNDSCIAAPCGNGMIDGSARVDTGWTAGVGLEYGITQNWTVKGEYLYAAFDGATFRARDTVAGAFTVPYSATSTNFNIVRVGVNYKFGGPVVAKY